MNPPQIRTWQAIQKEVLRRIHAREWPPGGTIPGEVELAAEFGCARATVNRALRALAEAGILERRRRAGTRVALHPVSRATLEVPVIRREVEARGHTHGYALLERAAAVPPAAIRVALDSAGDEVALHLLALHRADGTPYVLEDRWINLTTLPAARVQDFSRISANEWLLASAPYTHGEIALSAEAACSVTARHLNIAPGAPVFVIDRTTWDHARAITAVRLTYTPGYAIRTTLGNPG